MMNKYSDGTYLSSMAHDEDVAARQWQFAYREALGPAMLMTVLILIVLFLATFTLTGPLGTHDLTLLQRLAHFGIGAFLCAPLGYTKYVVVLYVTRFRPPSQIALAVAGGVLMASLPSTAIVYAVDTLIRAHVPFYSLPKMYLFVASSMLLCTAFTHYRIGQLLKKGPDGSPVATTPADESGRAANADGGTSPPAVVDSAVGGPPSMFFDRLPLEVGRDIIYLKMSDHYVEVVTTAGHCNILMRFADAITELGDRGVRVHRSYWVAYAHVEGWIRRNQRALLRLSDAHTVPVSRTYLNPARAAFAQHRVLTDTTGRSPTKDG